MQIAIWSLGCHFLSRMREVLMIALLSITTLTLATMFALAAATALHWLLLRATFHLMRPAATQRAASRTDLTRGTAGLTRAFAAHR
jgi:hypothetical protein